MMIFGNFPPVKPAAAVAARYRGSPLWLATVASHQRIAAASRPLPLDCCTRDGVHRIAVVALAHPQIG